MRTIDERTASLADTMRGLIGTVSGELRVAMPGIIDSWDADTQTASVRLALRERVVNAGAEKDLDIPLLVDVPVVMPKAGGYALAFTPRQGDEVLVIFADVCIDTWWQSGGIQNQGDRRRHDFSDGFAVFGCWSQPNKPSLPAEGIRMQTEDGSTSVHLTSGTVAINADSIALNGSVTVSDGIAITGSGTLNGQPIKTGD